MKKLALIVAMLLALPATASAFVLLDDNLESYALGTVAPWGGGLIGPNGENWGTWGTSPVIVNDPDVAGLHGQVWGFAAPYSMEEFCFVDTVKPTNPYPVDDPGEYVTFSTDYYLLPSDQMMGRVEWGPITDYYLDGNMQTPNLTLNAWLGGDQWDPYAANLVVLDCGPLPVNQWFNITEVYYADTMTCDLYLDGGLVASGLPIVWNEANYAEYHYWCWDFDLENIDAMFVDNVYMDSKIIPEPSMIALGAFGLLALLRRKK